MIETEQDDVPHSLQARTRRAVVLGWAVPGWPTAEDATPPVLPEGGIRVSRHRPRWGQS